MIEEIDKLDDRHLIFWKSELSELTVDLQDVFDDIEIIIADFRRTEYSIGHHLFFLYYLTINFQIFELFHRVFEKYHRGWA